jgi:DNA (cytosine-5)-methyltransferase 1
LPVVIRDRDYSKPPTRWSFDEPAPSVVAHGLSNVREYQVWIENERTNERTMTDAIAKPPYKIPLMSEIRSLPWNGLTVVSTFSGCGGSCLGYAMAGYRTIWASEFIGAAAETYVANNPGVHLDRRDIRMVSAADIRAVIGDVDVDVLEGSPPCAAFSTAGKRADGWGQVRKYSDGAQRVDDLFDEYVRLIDELRPKVFTAENVSGLIKGVAKGYFKDIVRRMKALGYVVESRLLDAQWLGVPQMRQRIIFQGVRADLGKRPAFPSPLPYRYSIRDALPWIDRVQGAYGFDGHAFYSADQPSGSIVTTSEPPGGNYKVNRSARRAPLDAPSPTVLAMGRGFSQIVIDPPVYSNEPSGGNYKVNKHARRAKAGKPCPTVLADPCGFSQIVIEPEADISRFAVGREWDRLAQGETSDRYFNLVKPSQNDPSPTVTASGGTSSIASVTHPTERRKFAIAELRRICGFPDDFILTGSYAQQWERLGRAVPPPMMRAVAEAIRDEVLR